MVPRENVIHATESPNEPIKIPSMPLAAEKDSAIPGGDALGLLLCQGREREEWPLVDESQHRKRGIDHGCGKWRSYKSGAILHTTCSYCYKRMDCTFASCMVSTTVDPCMALGGNGGGGCHRFMTPMALPNPSCLDLLEQSYLVASPSRPAPLQTVSRPPPFPCVVLPRLQTQAGGSKAPAAACIQEVTGHR